MGSLSPHRSSLYRKALLVVTLLGCAGQAWTMAAAQEATAPFARKPAARKGPRALGLIQILPKGKARLTPIAILVDGKFFDAGSYKGTPIPMALDFGVVYEAFRTGVSQGIFKITQPGQLGHVWIAEGTWLAAGAKLPELHKKAEIPNIEEKDAPPRLHKPTSGSSDQLKPATPPAAASPSPAQTSPAASPSAPAAAKEPPTPPAAAAPEPASMEDRDRPVLRREKPAPGARQERSMVFDESEPAAKSASGSSTASKDVAPKPVDLIPAISDAGGPDARPYVFDVKPEEETAYRSKMLDLAAAELRGPTKSETTRVSPTQRTGKTVAAKPAFTDIQLRIFDLSNSNQPVLVLWARTLPPAAKTAAAAVPREITLVARTNLEGDLHKLFFSTTDPQHLDVAPHMELIDAVDADGDGRGELLFRRTSDAGTSYAIYRATADQLWPLFEGTP